MSPDEVAELRYLIHAALRWNMTVKTIAGCVGKQAFDSFQDAQRAMRSDSIRRECSPYRCRFCKRLHIGRRRAEGKMPR